MAEKKAITREMRRRYRRSSKPGKASMLDELVALTGWTRSYASRVLKTRAEEEGGALKPAGARGPTRLR